jgi:hypothetical protein
VVAIAPAEDSIERVVDRLNQPLVQLVAELLVAALDGGDELLVGERSSPTARQEAQ